MSDTIGDVKTFQEMCAGVSVHFTWMGTTLSLKGEEKAQAAEAYGVDPEMFGASKKILNTKNAFYRALTTIAGQIKKLYSGLEWTMPWVEDGARLIYRERIPAFLERFEELRQQLYSARQMFVANWPSIKAEARELLKERYQEKDYPADPSSLFDVRVGWPNLTAPEYLKDVRPDLYQKEVEALQRKFERAIQKTTDGIAETLLGMVNHLADRLAPGEDGKPKKFQASTVENLRKFLDDVRGLKLSYSPELQAFLDRADALSCDLDPLSLRKDGDHRAAGTEVVARLQEEMEATIVTKPRRKLLLDAAPPTASELSPSRPAIYSPEGKTNGAAA